MCLRTILFTVILVTATAWGDEYEIPGEEYEIPNEDDKIRLLWTIVHEFDHLSKCLYYCPEILDIDQLLQARGLLKYVDSPLIIFCLP